VSSFGYAQDKLRGACDEKSPRRLAARDRFGDFSLPAQRVARNDISQIDFDKGQQNLRVIQTLPRNSESFRESRTSELLRRPHFGHNLIANLDGGGSAPHFAGQNLPLACYRFDSGHHQFGRFGSVQCFIGILGKKFKVNSIDLI
jgi:hypothetical protein